MNLRSLFLAIISATSANIFAEHTNATSVKNSKPQETCSLSSLRVPLTDKEVEERHAHEKLLEAAGKRVVITENPGQRPKFRTEYQACNCNPQLYAQTVKAHPAVASQYYGKETALHIAAKTCSAQDVEKMIAAHVENGISPALPTQISFGDIHNSHTHPDEYLFHLFTGRSDWQSPEDMAAVQRMITLLSKYIDINQPSYCDHTALSNVVLWDGWFNDKGITVEDQKKWAQLLIDNGATARW